MFLLGGGCLYVSLFCVGGLVFLVLDHVGAFFGAMLSC